MKKTGFNTQNVESAVEHIWPKLRKSLTMESRMTIKMFEVKIKFYFFPMLYFIYDYTFSGEALENILEIVVT